MSDFGDKPEKMLPASTLCPGYSLMSLLHLKPDENSILLKKKTMWELQLSSLNHLFKALGKT